MIENKYYQSYFYNWKYDVIFTHYSGISNRKNIGSLINNKLEKMWKAMVLVEFEWLSLNFTGIIKENPQRTSG